MITSLERVLRGYVWAVHLHGLRLPYLYGGGHPRYTGGGMDCSASDSEVLRAEGNLSNPRSPFNYNTELFERWGVSGEGKWRSLYVRDSRTLQDGEIHHCFIRYNADFLAQARKLKLLTFPGPDGSAIFQAEHTGTFVGFTDNDGQPWGVSYNAFLPRHSPTT